MQNRSRILILFVIGIIERLERAPCLQRVLLRKVLNAGSGNREQIDGWISCAILWVAAAGVTVLAVEPEDSDGGGMHFQSHKSDSFACRLQSDSFASADEDRFIASLKKPVEDSLRKYGANIKESGSREPRSFYLSYAINDIQGRIKVSGQRIGVDFYNLQADLEESK